MPGNVATLATCSAAWSERMAPISFLVGEDQAIHAHVGPVALRDA